MLAIARGADRLLNIGVAGGITPRAKIGSLWQIDRAVQYDFDLSTINGTPVGTLDEYQTPYFPLRTGGKFPTATLATADSFASGQDDMALLDSLGADVRDMEGAAIAHIAYAAGVPCTIFKSISDNAREESVREYRENMRCPIIYAKFWRKRMDKIPSFQKNHDVLQPGFHFSGVQKGVDTFDLRFKKPNAGDFISPKALHSVEHMLATALRNGKCKDSVLYFGPMGCRTGFYLLTTGLTCEEVFSALKTALVDGRSAGFRARRVRELPRTRPRGRQAGMHCVPDFARLPLRGRDFRGGEKTAGGARAWLSWAEAGTRRSRPCSRARTTEKSMTF